MQLIDRHLEHIQSDFEAREKVSPNLCSSHATADSNSITMPLWAVTVFHQAGALAAEAACKHNSRASPMSAVITRPGSGWVCLDPVEALTACLQEGRQRRDPQNSSIVEDIVWALQCIQNLDRTMEAVRVLAGWSGWCLQV